MERDNEIVGVIISIITFVAYKAGFLSMDLISGFSKGETYIFVLILGFIILWSVIHAICFFGDMICNIIQWLWEVLVINRKETLLYLNKIKRKIDAMIVAAKE